ANDLGDSDQAKMHLRRALEVTEPIAAEPTSDLLLLELGRNALARGNVSEARAHLFKAIDIERGQANPMDLVGSLSNAAGLEIEGGDFQTAEALAREALNAGLNSDRDWQLRGAVLVCAVIRFKVGQAWGARALAAATGWDVDPPPSVKTRKQSLPARAFEA